MPGLAMPRLGSSGITLAVTLAIATALCPRPASAQLDQAITRTQADTTQRAIENTLPMPVTGRPAAPCRGTAAAAPTQHPASAAPAGPGDCVTSAPAASR